MTFEPRQSLLLALVGTFLTALLLGDLIGVKLVEITAFDYPFVISVGMLPFPITFLLTDLLNEFYGKRVARWVTLLGLAMVVFAFAVILIAAALPWAPFTRGPDWKGATQPAFDLIFAGSRRMMVASLVAYVIAQFVDIGVFHAIKRLTQQRLLWLRATGSTGVSQLVDTVAIQTIAWWGILPADRIVSIIVTSYAVKLVIAVGLTPLIYLGHAFVSRVMGIRPAPIDDSRSGSQPLASA